MHLRGQRRSTGGRREPRATRPPPALRCQKVLVRQRGCTPGFCRDLAKTPPSTLRGAAACWRRRRHRVGQAHTASHAVSPFGIAHDIAQSRRTHRPLQAHDQPGHRLRGWQRNTGRACDQRAFETWATCGHFAVRPTHEAVTIPSAEFRVLLLRRLLKPPRLCACRGLLLFWRTMWQTSERGPSAVDPTPPNLAEAHRRREASGGTSNESART